MQKPENEDGKEESNQETKSRMLKADDRSGYTKEEEKRQKSEQVDENRVCARKSVCKE